MYGVQNFAIDCPPFLSAAATWKRRFLIGQSSPWAENINLWLRFFFFVARKLATHVAHALGSIGRDHLHRYREGNDLTHQLNATT